MHIDEILFAAWDPIPFIQKLTHWFVHPRINASILEFRQPFIHNDDYLVVNSFSLGLQAFINSFVQ